MSSKNLRALSAALAAVAVLGAFVAMNAFAGPSTGNPAAAKPIFASKCVVCHKADGKGGVKLTGNPTPNWTDPKTWADPKRKTDDYFRDCITNGKAPSGMIAWGKTKQLTPAQIEDMIAYIKTFKPKK